MAGEGPESVAFAAALGERARDAIRSFDRLVSSPTVMTVLFEDADMRGTKIAEHLRNSRFLPSSWNLRMVAVSDIFVRAATESTPPALEESRQILRELESHVLFDSHRMEYEQAEMAARLLAWLIDGKSAGWREPSDTTHGDVGVLGQFYAEQGGWLDRARRIARRPTRGPLAPGIAAITAAVDKRRLELDRRFAKALVGWYVAGRPAHGGALPIDAALEKIACRYLDGDEDRRVLVLLFDGMAWSQAVDIAVSMSEKQWQPLAWHSSAAGRLVAGQQIPVVLANVPTVTEVSRAAFFAGAPMPHGKAPVTSADPTRFGDNKKLHKLVPTTDKPKLFLKGDGHSASGHASEPALTKIRDTSQRIVGLVLNAIDAALKGDPQDHRRWDVDSIASLADLLQAAHESGRAVLMASDHGHVPSDLMRDGQTASWPKSKARWREYNDGEAVADYEVLLRAKECSAAFIPRGADGVALIADEQHRFGGSPGSGEHGGASMAEVVAPCLLFGHVGGPDETVPLATPGWWHFEIDELTQARRARRKSAQPAAAAKAKRPAKKVNENQPSLPTLAPPPEPTPEPQPEPQGESSSPLASSPLLEARARTKRLRAQVVAATDYLAERDGRASAEAFANAMKLSVGRVGGMISKLSEVLNIDGYMVIVFNREARQVVLDIELLEQQFEVTL